MTALDCPKVAESYNWHAALDYLNQGQVLIFAGGTGHPYFSTDTTAALRAAELQADILLKATKVDGVYDKDPLTHTNATKYNHITHSQVLADRLHVMDATAIALCRNGNIPIFVFHMDKLSEKQILTLLTDQNLGTLIKEG